VSRALSRGPLSRDYKITDLQREGNYGFSFFYLVWYSVCYMLCVLSLYSAMWLRHGKGVSVKEWLQRHSTLLQDNSGISPCNTIAIVRTDPQ
jgi:hypothetical protein